MSLFSSSLHLLYCRLYSKIKRTFQQTSTKACTVPPKLITTDRSCPLSMQVTHEQHIGLEPNQLQSETKQHLEQQIYEYGRLILTITIETLVISHCGNVFSAGTGVISPGHDGMALLTALHVFLITYLSGCKMKTGQAT
jgi:hypothetical protein